MRVPFGDLSRQYRNLSQDIDAAVSRVFRRGRFILGPKVGEFERQFAKFCGCKYSIGVANGMEALQIGLLALGIKKGDEVITTPISAAATALAIVAVGAKPVFVDIDPKNYNIDPIKIKSAITKKTKVIIPVHLYGQPADMAEIMSLASRYHIKVIEDAAQAHGAYIKRRHVGTFGDFGAFSFYPSKNLGAYGDGGALITNNLHLANLAKSLRDYGQSGRYRHEFLGLNSRLDELQAVILSVKLRRLTVWNKRRLQIAKYYNNHLSSLPIELPRGKKGSVTSNHLYVIRTQKRDQLQRHLATQKIQTQIHYPEVIYKQPAFRPFNYRKGLCPNAEKTVGEILSLPIFPELSEREVSYVCKKIISFFKNAR